MGWVRMIDGGLNWEVATSSEILFFFFFFLLLLLISSQSASFWITFGNGTCTCHCGGKIVAELFGNFFICSSHHHVP